MRRACAIASILLAFGLPAPHAARAAGPAAPAAAPLEPLMPAARPQYWYGVAVENIPPTIAKQLKLKSDQGLMVMAVIPKSPAEKAGLQPDDILIELDGAALTSQEDLARAANTLSAVKTAEGKSTPAPAPKANHLTYLRLGERRAVNITAAARPEAMRVDGVNTENFTAQIAPQRASNKSAGQANPANGATPDLPGPDANIESRNFVISNATAAQVGTGYSVPVNGNGASVTVQSLRELTNNGQTVVLTQETDPAGLIKNRITVGTKSYSVDAAHLRDLPPELRPLAQQLVDNTPAAPPASPDAAALAHRVDELEKTNQLLRDQNLETQRQNAETQRQLKELLDLLKSKPTPDPTGK